MNFEDLEEPFRVLCFTNSLRVIVNSELSSSLSSMQMISRFCFLCVEWVMADGEGDEDMAFLGEFAFEGEKKLVFWLCTILKRPWTSL